MTVRPHRILALCLTLVVLCQFAPLLALAESPEAPVSLEAAINTQDVDSDDIDSFDQSSAPSAPSALDMLDSEESVPEITLPLKEGDSGESVKIIQSELIRLGFLSGPRDGDYGPGTTEAVKNLQRYINAATALENVITDTEGRVVDATAAPPRQGDDVNDFEGDEEDALPIIKLDVEIVDHNAPRFEVNGIMDEPLYQYILMDQFPVFTKTLSTSQKDKTETRRVQIRLCALNYMYAFQIDADYGELTRKAITDFQRLNDIPSTGIADEETQTLLFSDNPVKGELPFPMYHLKVSVADQRVYAYKWDGKAYTQKTKTFKCSTGLPKTPTPKGHYTHTGPGARWHYFKKFRCWAQYAFYIQGDIMFHSVLYGSKNEKSLQRSSLNNLGRRASHGCVRLTVDDAKWIWTNCPYGTPITVY